MAFIVDRQTINDLNIFGKVRGNSVYGLFNATRTRGGAQLLEEMFRYPLSDADKINARSAVIRYFMEREIGFDFRNEWFDTVEHYLGNTDERTRLQPGSDSLQRRFRRRIGGDLEYEQLYKGVADAICLVNAVRDFLAGMEKGSGNPFGKECAELERLVQAPALAWTGEERHGRKLPYSRVAEYDRRLRFEGHEEMVRLLRQVYLIDVYTAVARTARERGFVFAEALPAGGNVLEIEGMFHPLLKQAVPNSIKVDAEYNVVFLTGANMAGKSTFMKTFGIVVFLAHIGLPVPAARMRFSVQNGMYTTINLPDNMALGYSHFYAEVQRLKKVAEQVGRVGNLVIVFDELFRGTNVKDAHEATVAVMQAFAEKKNCIFMISTHIIEAGEDLKQACDNVNYVYLPTVMKDGMPTYTYTLQQGITNDRHGMMIIRNEHIIDILKQ